VNGSNTSALEPPIDPDASIAEMKEEARAEEPQANGKSFHCANVKAQSPDTMCRAIAEATKSMK
jgi:hypothetical protein